MRLAYLQLNPETNAFQRKFVNEVRRCDEMERKLRYLEKEIKKDNIPMTDSGECPEAPQPREMIDLEVGLLFRFVGPARPINQFPRPAGHFRETGKRIARSEPKRRSIETQLPRVDRIEAYFEKNPSVFRRGKRIDT